MTEKIISSIGRVFDVSASSGKNRSTVIYDRYVVSGLNIDNKNLSQDFSKSFKALKNG